MTDLFVGLLKGAVSAMLAGNNNNNNNHTFSTKINILGPEIAWWCGGLPTEGVGVVKFKAFFGNFVFLGFQGREPGMSQEFCRDDFDHP